VRLWTLTRTPVTATTTRIEQVAADAGHIVERVDFEQVTVRHAYLGRALAGVPSDRPDVVLNRLHGDETHLRHGTRVQAALEAAGALGVNRSTAVAVAAVKSSTTQRFAAAGLPQPPTVVATVDSAPTALTEVTGVPLVLKPDRGTGARGVLRVDDADRLPTMLRELADRGVRELVAQPFLPEAAITIRAIVIGDRIVAAVAGDAPEGDWRASLDVAVDVRPVALPDHEQALAVAAASVCGLHLAGVDLVRLGAADSAGASGATLVLDVNPAPELIRTADAADVDLFGATVRFLERVMHVGRVPELRTLAAID
jgi:ribosomal protein S6--L-glutamate ligase